MAGWKLSDGLLGQVKRLLRKPEIPPAPMPVHRETVYEDTFAYRASEDIAAHAVITLTSTSVYYSGTKTMPQARNYVDGDNPATVAVSWGRTVKSGAVGRCSLAMVRPVLALDSMVSGGLVSLGTGRKTGTYDVIRNPGSTPLTPPGGRLYYYSDSWLGYEVETHPYVALLDDGGSWAVHSIAHEPGIANTSLSADTTYEVYAYLNDSTSLVALALYEVGAVGSGLDWVDGIPVLYTDNTYLLIGYIRTDASGNFEDTLSRRFVFNIYNRAATPLYTALTTGALPYTSGNDDVQIVGGGGYIWEHFVVLNGHANITATSPVAGVTATLKRAANGSGSSTEVSIQGPYFSSGGSGLDGTYGIAIPYADYVLAATGYYKFWVELSGTSAHNLDGGLLQGIAWL